MLLPASKAAKVTNADSLTGVAPSVPTTVAAVTTPAVIASVPKISPDLNPVPALLISILLNPDPQGSNGLLSADSFIARLGAKTLKKEFEDRIGRAIIRETLGKANILNVNSSSNLVNILTGNATSTIKSFRHNELPSFGSGDDKDEKHWNAVIRQALIARILTKEIEAVTKEALKTPLQGIVAALEGMKNRPDRETLLSETSFKKMMISFKPRT